MLYLEILVVIILTIVNGVLAMSELSIVSSRKARLESLAADGNKGARVALSLLADPNRFLSTVQIGITLVGIFAGAFSGATLAGRLGNWLNTMPIFAPNGETIAMGVVVVSITYLSLVVGELVPKRIALANPEKIAVLIARPMNGLSRFAAPAVWVLRSSTEKVLKLLGLHKTEESSVTEEEIKLLIAEGTQSGIFEPEERKMIEGVLRLADRNVAAIMTPRSEIAWIDQNAERDATAQALADHRFSRLLVCDGSIDHAVGTVRAKDLLQAVLDNKTIKLAAIMTPAQIVPDTTSIFQLLESFRKSGLHMAVVVDEYGATEGLVTVTDILEAITGDLPERGEIHEPLITDRNATSWLVDGMLPIDEFEDHVGLKGLRDEGSFRTLAGYMLHKIGHLPTAGEYFIASDFRFEVVDMDGRRIDKVLVEKLETAGTE